MKEQKKKEIRVDNQKINLKALTANIFMLVVECFIISIFIFFILLFIFTAIILLIEALKGDTSSIFNYFMINKCSCESPINCYLKVCGNDASCDCYSQYINTLLSLLSLSLAGILMPLISALATVFFSSKSISENFAKELAKAKDVKGYILRLPLGGWGNLASLFHKENKDKNKLLGNYKYAIHLLFNGDIFQAYDTKIKEISCANLNGESRHVLWQVRSDSIRFVSDVSGVKEFDNTTNGGTNITVLIENNNNTDIDNLISESVFEAKEIVFTIKFDEQIINFKDRWKQFRFAYTIFPILRTIYESTLFLKRRYIHYSFELKITGFCPTDEMYSQYQFNISDVSIKQVRRKLDN